MSGVPSCCWEDGDEYGSQAFVRMRAGRARLCVCSCGADRDCGGYRCGPLAGHHGVDQRFGHDDRRGHEGRAEPVPQFPVVFARSGRYGALDDHGCAGDPRGDQPDYRRRRIVHQWRDRRDGHSQRRLLLHQSGGDRVRIAGRGQCAGGSLFLDRRLPPVRGRRALHGGHARRVEPDHGRAQRLRLRRAAGRYFGHRLAGQ